LGDGDAAGVTFPYERVLVTGASGLVGCRLCEHLRLGADAAVRGTFHTAARAARVARLDVELVRADLADAAALERAVAGCDAVVHCAYGTTGSARDRRALTGAATGVLARAALRAGVRRFVLLSSAAVWGFAPDAAELDESVPARPTGHPYVDGKLDAERELLATAHGGLPAVVLRPGNVFGPYAEAFTAWPVRALRAGAPVLVGDGSTPANTVYVDNLVAAVVRALEREEAVGETFVVSDDDGVTWRTLLGAYARMAQPPLDVVALSGPEYRRLRKRRLGSALRELAAVARSPEARELVRLAAAQPSLREAAGRVAVLVPGGRRRARAWTERARAAPLAVGAAPLLPSEELAALQTSRAVLRSSKARRVLGWEPPVPFGRALELTEAWLRFSRLV
jgi:nucleoside-diphosphate-sugar epimerase